MKIKIVIPEYIEMLPPILENGKLYISKKYGTAIHLCCCGCGTKIVTPLKPTDWSITERNGRVTLRPSVGNWNHPCRSHYIIRDNRVIEAGTMSDRAVELGRALNEVAKVAYARKQSSHPKHRHPSLLESFKRCMKAMFR
jgi:hypothetical protein